MFVQRDSLENIVAVFANAQPGIAEEWVEGAEIEQPVQVPRVITMRQARLLLNSIGLLDQVQSAIDALPEPPRVAAQIEWDYSSEVHRDKQFVLMIAQQLELTDAQIDQMFIQASAL